MLREEASIRLDTIKLAKVPNFGSVLTTDKLGTCVFKILQYDHISGLLPKSLWVRG